MLAEISKMKEALGKTRADAKAAADLAVVAVRTFTDAKANFDKTAKQLADLRAKLPDATKAAETAKAEAERGAAIAEKELAAAKADAEKTPRRLRRREGRHREVIAGFNRSKSRAARARDTGCLSAP